MCRIGTVSSVDSNFTLIYSFTCMLRERTCITQHKRASFILLCALYTWHVYVYLAMQEETNILQGLSSEDYSQVRALVIDMVFATDMSSHFEHLNDMKSLLSSPDALVLLL